MDLNLKKLYLQIQKNAYILLEEKKNKQIQRLNFTIKQKQKKRKKKNRDK